MKLTIRFPILMEVTNTSPLLHLVLIMEPPTEEVEDLSHLVVKVTDLTVLPPIAVLTPIQALAHSPTEDTMITPSTLIQILEQSTHSPTEETHMLPPPLMVTPLQLLMLMTSHGLTVGLSLPTPLATLLLTPTAPTTMLLLHQFTPVIVTPLPLMVMTSHGPAVGLSLPTPPLATATLLLTVTIPSMLTHGLPKPSP